MDLLKEGYLMRKPGRFFGSFKRWKSKWFILLHSLADGLIFYVYSTQEDSMKKESKRKVIQLNRSIVISQTSSVHYSFIINITLNGVNVITMAASSNEEFVSWTKTIKMAVEKRKNPLKFSSISHNFSHVSNKLEKLSLRSDSLELSNSDNWIVEIIPSFASIADNLHGKFCFKIDKNGIIKLEDLFKEKIIKKWSIEEIQQCARSKTRFSIEILSKTITDKQSLNSKDSSIYKLPNLFYSFLSNESNFIYKKIENLKNVHSLTNNKMKAQSIINNNPSNVISFQANYFNKFNTIKSVKSTTSLIRAPIITSKINEKNIIKDINQNQSPEMSKLIVNSSETFLKKKKSKTSSLLNTIKEKNIKLPVRCSTFTFFSNPSKSFDRSPKNNLIKAFDRKDFKMN